MLLAVVGIVLNAYVISRLAQLACHDYERFKSGCGLPLAAMSGSDLLSLLSINAMVVLNQFLPSSVFTPAFGDIQCKVSSRSLTAHSTCSTCANIRTFPCAHWRIDRAVENTDCIRTST